MLLEHLMLCALTDISPGLQLKVQCSWNT